MVDKTIIVFIISLIIFLITYVSYILRYKSIKFLGYFIFLIIPKIKQMPFNFFLIQFLNLFMNLKILMPHQILF